MKTTFINEISFRYFLQLATWYSCVSACYILTNVSCGIISLQLELWPTIYLRPASRQKRITANTFHDRLSHR